MSVLKCRACLKEGDSLYYLFTETEICDEELDYATMMTQCADVKVDIDDEFSKGICSRCFDALRNAFTFKMMCEKSFRIMSAEVNEKTYVQKMEEEEEIDDDNKDEIISAEDIVTLLNDSIKNDPSMSNDESDEVHMKITLIEDDNDDVIEEEDNDDSDNKYICEECEHPFSDINEYTYHLARHGCTTDSSGNKRYQCKLCGKILKNLNGLKYHIEAHKGIKRFKCRIKQCNWSFITKHSLEKHLMTHTNEKPCMCVICGKPYSTNDALAHHVKTHSGVRPHECPHCQKTFLQASHLKKHLLSHLGIKPYTCEKCGRSYSTRTQLKKHFNKFCGQGIDPVFKFRDNNSGIKSTSTKSKSLLISDDGSSYVLS